MKETILDLWKEKGRTFELETKKYENYLTTLEDKRKRIFEMREDDSYTKEEVENEIAPAKISLSEPLIEQFDIESALTYATNFISNLGRQWFDLSPQLRPRFQNLVFPKGIPYDREKGFETAKLGLIFNLNQEFLEVKFGQKSQVVDPEGFEPSTPSLPARYSAS